MKEIPNMQFDETASTVSLLTTATNYADPGRGMDLSTMRKRLRVLDAIAKVPQGGMIQLEDGDFETAKQAIQSVQWMKPSLHIIKFAEQFGL